MIATLEPPSPLDRWRRRFGGRRRFRARPRPLAAIGYLTNGPVVEGLVEIDKLTLVVLYDEPVGRGPFAVRLAGYGGSAAPWGVRFGGADQCRFFKDLALQPVAGARGYRIDRASDELLALGLRLDRELDRGVRRPGSVRCEVRLPCLWAAFRPGDAAGIAGEGPELEAFAERTGQSAAEAMARLRRAYFGLTLYPAAWVSHHWRTFLGVFADLARFPRQQVFALSPPEQDGGLGSGLACGLACELPGGLAGYRDAAEFDLYASRFRRDRRPRRSRPRRPAPSERRG